MNLIAVFHFLRQGELREDIAKLFSEAMITRCRKGSFGCICKKMMFTFVGNALGGVPRELLPSEQPDLVLKVAPHRQSRTLA